MKANVDVIILIIFITIKNLYTFIMESNCFLLQDHESQVMAITDCLFTALHTFNEFATNSWKLGFHSKIPSFNIDLDDPDVVVVTKISNNQSSECQPTKNKYSHNIDSNADKDQVSDSDDIQVCEIASSCGVNEHSDKCGNEIVCDEISEIICNSDDREENDLSSSGKVIDARSNLKMSYDFMEDLTDPAVPLDYEADDTDELAALGDNGQDGESQRAASEQYEEHATEELQTIEERSMTAKSKNTEKDQAAEEGQTTEVDAAGEELAFSDDLLYEELIAEGECALEVHKPEKNRREFCEKVASEGDERASVVELIAEEQPVEVRTELNESRGNENNYTDTVPRTHPHEADDCGDTDVIECDINRDDLFMEDDCSEPVLHDEMDTEGIILDATHTPNCEVLSLYLLGEHNWFEKSLANSIVPWKVGPDGVSRQGPNLVTRWFMERLLKLLNISTKVIKLRVSIVSDYFIYIFCNTFYLIK